MIEQLRSIVLDCREPAELAEFYGKLLGASRVQDTGDWMTVEDARGQRVSFQRSPEHRAPRFPDPNASQQLHLDVLVDDPDEAEQAVLAIGATRLDGASEGPSGFRVFADPAGHPFCLVWLH